MFTDRLKAREIYNIDPESAPPGYLGSLFPASVASINAVLDAEMGDDGRSPFYWLRLANGDLALVSFPRGELYEGLESQVGRDYESALYPS